MRDRVSQDLILGVFALAFGLIVIFLWAPLDSGSGIAEKVRGRWSIGDALAPTIAGGIVSVSGLMIVIGSWFRTSDAGLTLANARYLVAFLLIIVVSFAVMRYAGPVVADLLAQDYRPLRDEVPWKYLGFVLGGGGMIFGLISLVEGQFRGRYLALALMIAGSLALIYDLPFEDLLMPPNGDV